MQITVTIPDELADEVQARGLTPQSYVESLIDSATSAAPLSSPGVGRQRDMQRFFHEMAAHSDKIPQLPDEAFTRESFYMDHD